MFIPWATLNQWCKAHLKVRIVSLKRLKYLNGALSKAMSIAFGAVQRLLDPLGMKKQHQNAWARVLVHRHQKMPEPKPSYQK